MSSHWRSDRCLTIDEVPRLCPGAFRFFPTAKILTMIQTLPSAQVPLAFSNGYRNQRRQGKKKRLTSPQASSIHWHLASAVGVRYHHRLQHLSGQEWRALCLRFPEVKLTPETQCRILPGGQQSFGDGESLRRRPLELPIEPRSESRLAGTCHLLTILCGCGFELRAPLLAPARARRTKNRSHARRS